MDIRVKKTRSCIINAFIELRSKKPLEKITIKELCDTAMINKSTFYSHYDDIYDLSDSIETEIVSSVINNLEHPEALFEQPTLFTQELFSSYLANDALIQTVFSGTRQGELIRKMEASLKELIFSFHPEYQQDPIKNIILSHAIYGGYYAFAENRNYGVNMVVSVLGEITEATCKLLK